MAAGAGFSVLRAAELAAMLRAALALAGVAMSTTLLAAPQQYAEGQVWEYRVRPSDPNSLLKIQKIDIDQTRPVNRIIYHISIVGVRLNDPAVQREISHVPVSREALDDSVTRLARRPASFPDAQGGIEEWTRANGGVFTTPIAQIIDVVEKTMRNMPDQ
ncbi:MAG: hypothetical protein AB7G25_11880 [Sphingomonadaceae bacterium]